MKRLLYILMLITLAGGLASCEGSEPDTGKKYSFLFAENPVMAGANGGECEVMIIADTEYTPVALDNWISDVTKVSAELVTFKVSANSSDKSRDGKIAFYIDGTEDVKELTVRQAASASGLKVSISSHDFPVTGGEQEIKVSTPASWEIDSCPDWISATKKNASALVLSAGVNYAGAVQNGKVVLKTATETAEISVSQNNDNSLFRSAKTPMGRRFVYNTGSLVNVVAEDKSYSLTEGVNVLEIKYKGKISGTVLDYAAFVCEIDLTKSVTVLATCKDDDPANIKKTDAEATGVQIIREQLIAMQNSRASKTVFGGINGDFFFGEGSETEKNSLLQGVMHKDGVALKETFDGGSACTVFAMMKDGTARIMSQTQYRNSKNDIAEAIGGRQSLLESGVITTANNNKSDPRTAVGVSADRNKVIFVVMDGRQQNYSNGAEYPEIGNILKAMGAYNGINLDGGGSSTFIVRENNSLVLKNKPSNSSNTERQVVNGLAIISK